MSYLTSIQCYSFIWGNAPSDNLRLIKTFQEQISFIGFITVRLSFKIISSKIISKICDKLYCPYYILRILKLHSFQMYRFVSWSHTFCIQYSINKEVYWNSNSVNMSVKIRSEIALSLLLSNNISSIKIFHWHFCIL